MAAISTLTDSFPSSLDTGKWSATTNTGGSASVVSGELTLAQNWDSDTGVGIPGDWTGVTSVNGYEFAGSSLYCRFKPPTFSSNGWMVITLFGAISATAANDEGVGWEFIDGTLYARIWNDIGDTWQVAVGSLTYSSTDHAWIRIREASDTFYWDTAPDSSGSPGSWTQRFSYSKTGSGVSFDDMAAFLGTAGAKAHARTYHYDTGLSASNVTTNPKIDGVNTATVTGTTHATTGVLATSHAAAVGSVNRVTGHVTTAVLAAGQARVVGHAGRATTGSLQALVDGFNAGNNQLDTAKWSFSNVPDAGGTSNGTYDLLSGRLRLFGTTTTPNDGDAFMTSVSSYSLVGSSVTIRVSANTHRDRVEMGLRVQSPANADNYLAILSSENVFNCLVRANAAWSMVDADQTYDRVAHAWLQIREASGTIHFEAAPDDGFGSPGTWTSLATFPTASVPWSLTSVKVRLHRRAMSVALPSTNDGIVLVDAVNCPATHFGGDHVASAALVAGGTPRLTATGGSGGIAGPNFKDSFDGGTLNASKWAGFVLQGTGSFTQSNGRLNIAVTSSGASDRTIVESLTLTTLAGCAAFARLAQAVQTSANVNGAEAAFQLTTDDGANYVAWHQKSDGSLSAQRMVASVVVEAVSVAYTPATHAWLRIRETAGTIYWETAPSSAQDPPREEEWVVRHSKATADVGFAITALRIHFLTQVFDAGAGVPSTAAQWDCVNARTQGVLTHAVTAVLAARLGSAVGQASKKVTHATTAVLSGRGMSAAGQNARRFEHTASGALAAGAPYAIISANSSTSDVTRKVWFDAQDTAGAWSEPPQTADPWTNKPEVGGNWGS